MGLEMLAARARPLARSRRIPLVILMALSAVFVARSWPLLTGPFGDSHDGRNAGVWAEGSRAIREHGVIASRFGARTTEGGVTETYANHPPLIYLETAVTEEVAGAHPWASRMPAFLGSLALIVLLYLLLLECGLDPLPSAAGVAVALSVRMFLVYGTMLDTPVTSLPIGVALLLLWRRAANGRPAPKATAVVAALTVLAGWQGFLLAGILGGEALLRRRDRSLAAGAAAGTALLAGWFWWALGSFHELGVQLIQRSGHRPGAHIGLGDVVVAQSRYIVAMFPIVVLLLAVPAVSEALRIRGLRTTMWAALAVSLLYTAGLRDGAFFHQYWDYWWLLPLALGMAALAVRVAKPAWIVAAVGIALLLAAVVEPGAAKQTRGGMAAARVVAAARPFPPTQRTAWFAGMADPAWLRYQTRLPVQGVATPAQIDALATEHPQDLVTVRTGNRYEVVPAADLRR